MHNRFSSTSALWLVRALDDSMRTPESMLFKTSIKEIADGLLPAGLLMDERVAFVDHDEATFYAMETLVDAARHAEDRVPPFTEVADLSEADRVVFFSNKGEVLLTKNLKDTPPPDGWRS